MPRRTTSFRLWMSGDERQQLMNVAKRLRRSESDAIRWLVAEAAAQYGEIPGTITADAYPTSPKLRRIKMTKE